MNTAAGYITLVQEGRFQFACDDGTRRLFILGHDAPLEAEALRGLQRKDAHLLVRYDDAPGLILHVAHGVRELKEPLNALPR